MDLKLLSRYLEEKEGRRYFVYDDATGKTLVAGMTLIGNPTIGVGRCLNKKGISDHEADIFLANDCLYFVECANKYSWFLILDKYRQVAICSMIFQLGEKGFSEFHDMIIAMENCDYPNAYKNGKDSVWYHKFPVRAEETLHIILSGVLPLCASS